MCVACRRGLATGSRIVVLRSMRAPLKEMQERLWYLDSLRACLMIAGVFLHAAAVYGANTQWVVVDPAQGLRVFDTLVAALHSFRMPAFFMLAGMFWTYVAQRNRLRHSLLQRAVLVGLPFLTLVLTLQPLQHLLLLTRDQGWVWPSWGSFWASYWQPGVISDNAFFGRSFIGHLWFLVTLLLYYPLAAVTVWLSFRTRREVPERVWLLLLREKWLWVLVAGGAMIVLRAALRHGLDWPMDVANIVRYLPYFAFGALGFASEARLQALQHLGPRDWLALALSAVVLYVPGVNEHLHGALRLLCELMFAFGVSVLLLVLFRRFLDRPWPWLRPLVDASFSVYLFHYFVVVVLALLLIPAEGLPIPLKYLLVTAGGVLLPFLLHQRLIARYRLMRLLLNGRWPKERTAPTPHLKPA